MKAIAFKLVLRSWWRNKTFSIISILSLAIGIACTNLLAVFVIHEYNLEADNPNRDNIYMMDQDSPVQPGERITYVLGSITPTIKEKYADVIDYLRLNQVEMDYLLFDNMKYAPITLVMADSSFLHFFPYKVLYGDVKKALTEPDQIVLMEKYAEKLFGKKNPVGETIATGKNEMSEYIINSDSKEKGKVYTVAAVLKEREQSFLKFDALTGNINPKNGTGGIAMIMTNHPIDTKQFSEQVKTDGIETLYPEGTFYFNTLTDAYFKNYTQVWDTFINNRQRSLLYVGLFSAILILLIACFNYINLNFSRLLQQVRMIHTQKLMGASSNEISRQLFTDVFLTVLVAFMLSLLITHDLIPIFNSIVSAQLKTSFFFNRQTLPVICLFILILSIVPAFYLSRKVLNLSIFGYRDFFIGNKKRKIVTILSVVQYTISIGLIIATLTVTGQLRLTKKSGERYHNLIEVGKWNYANSSSILAFVEELKKHPEIQNFTVSGSSLLDLPLIPIENQKEDGSKVRYFRAQYMGEQDFFKLLNIRITKGYPTEKALEQFQIPVYVTQRFVDLLIPKNEDPIGQLLSKYDSSIITKRNREEMEKRPPIIIAGIVEDLYTNTLNDEVFPSIIYLANDNYQNGNFVIIRLGADKKRSLANVQQIWDKVNPDKYFCYQDVYAEFMHRNRKTTELSQLLIMYSIISLFLTCFGLFGMALYATEQRTKEIGIRKVNGASTLQIMLLLNKQFVTWIGIAFVIAIPIVWLFLNRWLEHFAHHTEMSVFHFLLSGIFVLLITLLTISWHTYKAASGNPVNVLKSE